MDEFVKLLDTIFMEEFVKLFIGAESYKFAGPKYGNTDLRERYLSYRTRQICDIKPWNLLGDLALYKDEFVTWNLLDLALYTEPFVRKCNPIAYGRICLQ